ncbi:MAG: hypothetical protein JWN56_42 [Sphingobacteriales bacterium]|nr:hypothetical protein [Sphingobacteriales bacterium]
MDTLLITNMPLVVIVIAILEVSLLTGQDLYLFLAKGRKTEVSSLANRAESEKVTGRGVFP